MVGLVSPIAAQRAASHDWRIVPGVRVGPITAASSEPDLRRAFGGSAVVNEEVDVGEGMTEPGTVIYKRDPSRALSILWDGEGANKHPATIFVCYGLAEGSCRWQTGDGIRFGTTLRELEALNRRPFVLTGFGWDYSGTVVSWEEGELARKLEGRGRLLLRLLPRADKDGETIPRLTPKEYGEVSGDRDISSSHAVMRKLDPAVYNMVFEFPKRARKQPGG